MFRPPKNDETKPASEETIFQLGEDNRKPALVTHLTNETTGLRPNDRGPS
jgi:hypothetical protein